METQEKEKSQIISNKLDSIDLTIKVNRSSAFLGVHKKSLRPSRSMKPISLFPKKLRSIPRVQKLTQTPAKNSELA